MQEKRLGLDGYPPLARQQCILVERLPCRRGGLVVPMAFDDVTGGAALGDHTAPQMARDLA